MVHYCQANYEESGLAQIEEVRPNKQKKMKHQYIWIMVHYCQTNHEETGLAKIKAHKAQQIKENEVSVHLDNGALLSGKL